MVFLAHCMRISDVLTWDRKSDLTYVFLPRLSREGCTLVVLELAHMIVKCKVTSSYQVASPRTCVI